MEPEKQKALIDIYRASKSVIFQIAWETFRLTPQEQIYLEKLDDLLTEFDDAFGNKN